MTLEEFDSKHGSVITAALESYAERMRETAAECAKGAEAPGQPEPEPAPGTISVRPTQSGFSRMVSIFTEQATRADAVLKAWRDETEGPDEEDAELLGIDPDGTHHFRV